MSVRMHYVPDCENESGNDTLAVSTADYDKVNCPTCIHEMYASGVLSDDISFRHLGGATLEAGVDF